MSRSSRLPSSLSALAAMAFLAGCPEGARQEQWTPEADPHASAAAAPPSASVDPLLALVRPDASQAPTPATAPTSGDRDGSASERSRGSQRKLQLGQPKVTGALPPEVVQRVVRGSFGRLRLCYENALKQDRYLAGSLTLELVIGADGKVEPGSAVVTDAGSLAPMTDCLTAATKSIAFPPPESGTVRVSHPMTFAPGDLDGVINGHALEDVTLDDVSAALAAAGYDVLDTTARGDTGVMVIHAKKADEAFEITFVPYEEHPARLTREEWEALDAVALVHHFHGFGLAVKTERLGSAKALLVAVILPAG